MLLDEPTGDLDTRSTDIVMNILIELNRKRGITMVMVTHDVALKAFANRVIRMADGKVSKIQEMPKEIREEQIKVLEEKVR